MAFLAMTVCASLGAYAASDSYPSRPIRLVVPFSPGGGSDDFQKAMGAQGNEPFELSRADFDRFIRSEVAKWAKLGRDCQLRVE